MNVTVDEIKKDPAGYLHRVIEGETLVVFENDRAVAEIRPIEEVHAPRPFGLAAGRLNVPDDFDAPLPHEVIEPFEAE